MAVHRLALRFECATHATLPVAPSTQRGVKTHAERSVPELAAIFEAGAGGDADAFVRRLRTRPTHSTMSIFGLVNVNEETDATAEKEKEQHVETTVPLEPTPLHCDLVLLASPDASLLTPSLMILTAGKKCLKTMDTPSDDSTDDSTDDDDERSVTSSQPTELVSDDESIREDPLQAESETDSETEQPAQDDLDLSVEPTIEPISTAADLDSLATNEPVLHDVETTIVATKTMPMELISSTADHDMLATNERGLPTSGSPTVTTSTTSTTSTTATTSTTPTETPTETPTATTTVTAAAATSPSPASSRSRASSRPRLDQKLQPPSVVMLSSRPASSSSTPSSTPACERSSAAVAARRRSSAAPAAAPTTGSMPRRDMDSRYMNFAHSDRFLEERQRNVVRRQELAARSQ
jgi:hypothetical protein